MTLCTIELSSGKGSCKLSAKKLNAGTYEVLATYAGSANFYGSASAKETFTVATAISKTTLKLSAAKATYGDERVDTVSRGFPAVSGHDADRDGHGQGLHRNAVRDQAFLRRGSCRLTPKKLKVRTYQVLAPTVAVRTSRLNFGQGDTHRRHLMSCRVVGVPATGDR